MERYSKSPSEHEPKYEDSVTSEMIEAGAMALWDIDFMECGAGKAALLVYRAMTLNKKGNNTSNL